MKSYYWFSFKFITNIIFLPIINNMSLIFCYENIVPIAYIHVCARTKVLRYWFKLGLSNHPPDPTHSPTSTKLDLLPTKPTSLAIGDGFLPPKLDFDWSNIGLLLQNPRNPN